MLIALMIAAATPSPGAVALGERLARTGALATLLPVQAARETEEMVAQNPELSAAEQAALRRVAKTTADALAARLFVAEGQRYAELLPEADLRVLVAQAESPAAARLRAMQPQVIASVIGTLAGVDYKGETKAAFCRETGKLCAGAPSQ